MNTLPRVVVLTGAGISAESGLQTFRDNNGLWESHRIEDVATPDGFARNPELVYRFYNARRAQLQQPSVSPNAAHTALATLERHLADNFLLVTQNVDNLHERAGSERVLHMHGRLLAARCSYTGDSHMWEQAFDGYTPCPCCGRPGQLRPDIVWFGEMPMYMDTIYEALSQADFFVSIGTSGQVYPAAGFVQIARDAGAATVELNLEASERGAFFSASYQGPASTLVPDYVDSFIEQLTVSEQ